MTSTFCMKYGEAGVRDDAIHAMTVDNPLRFLAFVPRSA